MKKGKRKKETEIQYTVESTVRETDKESDNERRRGILISSSVRRT